VPQNLHRLESLCYQGLGPFIFWSNVPVFWKAGRAISCCGLIPDVRHNFTFVFV
jgi:hypothetical protein